MVRGRVSEQRAEDTGSAAPRFAYSDVFWDRLPYYLAMGMPYELYWQGPARAARAYRKAAKLKSEQRNEAAWLQGAYIYDALGKISPAFRDFAKSGTKVEPYMERPFGAVEVQSKTEKSDAQAKAAFESWMTRFNQRMVQDGGD